MNSPTSLQNCPWAFLSDAKKAAILLNSTRLYDQSTFIEIFQSFEEPRTSLKESDIPEKLTTSTFPSSNNDPVNHARVCAGRYLNLNTSLKENLATPEE